MANQDISDLSKKRYLCLLGFPQTQKANAASMVDDQLNDDKAYFKRVSSAVNYNPSTFMASSVLQSGMKQSAM